MSGDAAHTLWIERYRPKEFSEVHGQQHIMKRLEAFVKSKNIPHCIFSGPAGVAKTTSALIIARKLYGEEWKRNFLELNSSDQRGIDTVRSIIKDFCRTKAMGTDLPKIIFLDEADALTKDAQHSLRRMMEQYAGTSRFILSCVTPDTKILLPQDLEIDIEQFFKFYEQRKINKIRNFQLNNANSKNDTVLAAVKLPVHHLQKKVLKITTMSGRKI
ncbi:MAG TPA: AAA family ATPase, partial [Candidatus Nanoarchaeia archaeon]|nr:AAA family ATPase [Candidatus Nanoarchaeia archaeon]